MTKDGSGSGVDGRRLSQALRGVRRLRRLSSAETAARMHLSLRSYQRFEAGAVRLNIDHVHRFAAATGSDAHAILLAVAIGSPQFAVRAADNQMGAILTIALQKFDEAQGDRLARLDIHTLIRVIGGAFDELGDVLGPDDPDRTWIDDGLGALAERRPKPGR